MFDKQFAVLTLLFHYTIVLAMSRPQEKYQKLADETIILRLGLAIQLYAVVTCAGLFLTRRDKTYDEQTLVATLLWNEQEESFGLGYGNDGITHPMDQTHRGLHLGHLSFTSHR